MAGPQPIAQGDLGQTPLAHVMMSVHGRSLSGTLAVWPSDGRGQDRIYFDKGTITKARLLEASNDLVRGLLPLFQRSGVPYAFYEEDLIVEESAEGHVDPLALVAASLRGGMRDSIVESVLSKHGGKLLRIKPGTPIERFGFIKSELTFLEMFRAGPINVDTAMRTSASGKNARRVLYMLSIADAIDHFEGEVARPLTAEPAQPVSDRPYVSGRPPSTTSTSSGSIRAPAPAPVNFSAAPSSSSGPPAPKGSIPPARTPKRPEGLPKALDLRWDEVVSYASTIDEQNYFEMLGVTTNAGSEDIREAYFTKVKHWHPDRLPPELSPLRDMADIIFRHLTDAEKTLSDADQRKQYFTAVQDGGGTPQSDRKLNTLLMAALEFQKVQVLLRRKDYTTAEKIVRELIATVPDEADYQAALGAILWRRDGVKSAREAMELTELALGLHDTNERALMTKAQILLRQEKVEEAYDIFRLILKKNPRNVEAQRHLRLGTMRQGKAPKKKSNGFLSGFFGGNKSKKK
ncbi:MAG: curved DNA-binding protein CbpA [Polyangiales bacterium]|jgi:curved DNA-binding protein CbpA